MKLYRKIKYHIRTFRQGFPDMDVWNLDHAILTFTLPRLKRHREITYGYPNDLSDYPEGSHPENAPPDTGFDKWLVILDKMIRAMELKLKDEYWYVDNPNKDEEEAAVKEGMELFHEYFDALWI